MKPELKGLIAAFAAIGLMTAWGVLAAGDEASISRNLEATVYLDRKDGGDIKDAKQKDVTIQVQPLGGGHAKCSDQSKREYEVITRGEDRLYQLKTSGQPGNDYGKVFFSQCVRGMYQVSAKAPAGHKLSDVTPEHQIIKVEQNKTINVEFVMERL